jgi:hypothetical protein
MKKIFTLLFFFCFSLEVLGIEEQVHISNDQAEQISNFLDNIVIKNVLNQSHKSFKESYKYLKDIDEVRIFENKKVFLFYEGLPYGGIWSKPGAKNFGGERVKTIYFDEGPIEASVIAHKELRGNRNYFYVLIEAEDLIEGWIGRPYVMVDPEGKTFLMPNPTTGEAVRDVVDVKFDITLLREILVEKPTYFIPSYKKVSWKDCLWDLPEEIKIEGYRLYMEAFQEGQREVDQLVSNYLSANPY